jgi:hypothetical protein
MLCLYRDWLDALTAPEPGDHPWNAQARTTTETVLPKGGDAGAGARAGPHAWEDCGGDPRCRHLCRVGTVVMSSMLATPTINSFPVAPECV